MVDAMGNEVRVYIIGDVQANCMLYLSVMVLHNHNVCDI